MEIPWKSHVFFSGIFPWRWMDGLTIGTCGCLLISAIKKLWIDAVVGVWALWISGFEWCWCTCGYQKNNNCVFLCDVTNKKLVMRISSFKIWRFSAIFMVHEIHTSSFLAFCDTLIVTNCGNVGHQPRAWRQPSASHRWIHAKIWGMCWVPNSKPQVMVKLWAPNADWVWFSIPQISS